jgi:hypothetical protein
VISGDYNCHFGRDDISIKRSNVWLFVLANVRLSIFRVRDSPNNNTYIFNTVSDLMVKSSVTH